MSIEAMKQVIELYDKHCYNNDYGGIEFNKNHGYKFIEAIEALRTAIQQAEAQQPATGEPVAEPFVATYSSESIGGKQHDTGRVNKGPRGGFFASTASFEDASLIADALNAYTHPAPGVPDGWVDAAERVPLESDGEVFVRFTDGSIGTAWATYWHGASNAFAQWTHPDPDEDRTIAHWMKAPALAASPAQKGPDHGDPRQKAVPDPA